ncbi:MAG: putative DNA modification/repair radical SAM protein [Roseiflexaceae bacterium]
MDLEQKLHILAPAAQFDACDTFAQPGKRYTPRKASWPTPGVATENGPDGKRMPIFRLLMSSRCEWNCTYCPLRSEADAPRATLAPEELAQAFLPRAERGAVQGLLLSTGVDGDQHQATSRMLDGVEHLRTHHHYSGYIHVKLLPGTARYEIERAVRLADRLSINLEAPSAAHLAKISPERNWLQDLVERMVWMREWQRSGQRTRLGERQSATLPAGIATQFVVGASGESDRELLSTTTWLYRELDLRRIYFGAFRPANGTPLAAHEATPFVREQRLREADWLLRHYEFGDTELPYDPNGHLPLHQDPKLAWALAHPERFPIEINTADPSQLLRVPGIGPLAVRRILRWRKENPFRTIEHLRALGHAANRAADFLTLDGRFYGRGVAERAHHYAPRGPIAEQLTLW